MLLNVSIFMWYGAVCPWSSFLRNDVIPLYRLVPLGILVLLLRRLPWVFALHKKIPQIEEVRQAIFVGFFGPVGVSAIFYLYITTEFLDTLQGSNGELREDVASLPEAVTVIVWFLCITSVVSVPFFEHPQRFGTYFADAPHQQVTHGLSIPLGKLGFYLPQTISRSVTDDPTTGGASHAPFHIGSRVNSIGLRLPTFTTAASSARPSRRNSQEGNVRSPTQSRSNSVRPVWRIGGTVIRDRAGGGNGDGSGGDSSGAVTPPATTTTAAAAFDPANRTIRFPDDDDAAAVRGGGGGGNGEAKGANAVAPAPAPVAKDE